MLLVEIRIFATLFKNITYQNIIESIMLNLDASVRMFKVGFAQNVMSSTIFITNYQDFHRDKLLQ